MKLRAVCEFALNADAGLVEFKQTLGDRQAPNPVWPRRSGCAAAVNDLIVGFGAGIVGIQPECVGANL